MTERTPVDRTQSTPPAVGEDLTPADVHDRELLLAWLAEMRRREDGWA